MSQLGWVVGKLKDEERLFGNFMVQAGIIAFSKHRQQSTSHKYEHLQVFYRKLTKKWDFFRVFFTPIHWWKIYWALCTLLFPRWDVAAQFSLSKAFVNLLLVFHPVTPGCYWRCYRKIWLMLMILLLFKLDMNLIPWIYRVRFLMTRDSQWKTDSENIRIQVCCWTI